MRIQPKNVKQLATVVILVTASLSIAACSSSKKAKLDPFAGKGSTKYTKAGKIPRGGGRRHIGKPYKVAGITFYPREDPSYNKVGIASWYGSRFHRRKTANGEWYDMNYLTAAHTTLPLPSYARVTNLETGKQIIVRVNDRGPFVNDRIIDLSRKSASVLGILKRGTGKVRVEYIGPAPLNDNGRHLVAMNRELNRGTPKHQLIAAASRKTGVRIRAASAYPNNRTGYTTGSGYYVQVGAYGLKDNARRASAMASRLGPVKIMPVSALTGTIYRVRIGPLASQNQALEIQQQAHNQGIYDAKIVVN